MKNTTIFSNIPNLAHFPSPGAKAKIEKIHRY